MSTAENPNTRVEIALKSAVEAAAKALTSLDAGRITNAAAWADRSSGWAALARKEARRVGSDEARGIAAKATAAAKSAQPAIEAWKARRASTRSN
jgi:NAD-specific glutamate dehydrogenase